MTDEVSTGVAAENLIYATPTELRSIAEVADRMNESKAVLELAGNGLTFDEVAVYDGAGNKLGVLVWRMESDSFGIALGG